ncbi:leucyl aminopeptidase family protein [Sphingomonas sp. MAH-20]|uniref:Leucyl aminopeptidase family protein n=1 Tax=Sphingomonas horti TaxID=2682842 RepID=A0A6I4IWY5_9SPHN|nr:leucyl aminopeptidase family protein [Sphingomonas sp. CGMCC 1.13658]MBA2920365.1 leucyl aminopeptidase family protein [Sphingomonas sp. CGMCC 1.13658]MVO76619.1 leucyl aminopeptidase family protein [Sphingomonas horti]
MSALDSLVQPDRGQAAHAIRAVDKAGLDDWLKTQPPRAKAAAMAQRFAAKPGEMAILPGDGAEEWSVAVGVESAGTLGPWCLAKAAENLPEGSYRLEGQAGGALLGWLLAQHRFDRYRKPEAPAGPRVLVTGDAARIEETVRVAEAVALVRDLVNTPTEDMGPAQLQQAVEQAAAGFGATVAATAGDALADGYPLVHAVGRAAARDRSPRLMELEWGNPAHPRVAVVGKGVCFDTGGLDIKPAAGMRLMKKDMGGAAHALALARLVMGGRLPVRLHLLIPAVENAISGNAIRPGDVLRSRKGPTVEVSNTDAEGRLILADALARAGEEKPALIIDFATLTGAARVALGPDLPATFANDDMLAADLLEAGAAEGDPLWRMPLWAGYDEMLRSEIADIDNAPEGGMAGSVTAALFLQRFVEPGTPWAHLDTFAWRPAPRPGRPKGGEALGLRAAWAMLRKRYAPVSSS